MPTFSQGEYARRAVRVRSRSAVPYRIGVLIASKGNPCGQILRSACETMPQLRRANLKVLRKPSKYSNICNMLSAGDFIVKLLFSNSL
jgi:hypothetical protein